MINYTPPPAIVVPAPKVQTEEQFYAELMKQILEFIRTR